MEPDIRVRRFLNPSRREVCSSGRVFASVDRVPRCWKVEFSVNPVGVGAAMDGGGTTRAAEGGTLVVAALISISLAGESLLRRAQVKVWLPGKLIVVALLWMPTAKSLHADMEVMEMIRLLRPGV